MAVKKGQKLVLLPVQPLFDWVKVKFDPFGDLDRLPYVVMGVRRRTFLLWKAKGRIELGAADAVCVKIGAHLVDIWPDVDSFIPDSSM